MLAPEDIEDFRDLCAVHLGLDLTAEEAEREARSFFRFIAALESNSHRLAKKKDASQEAPDRLEMGSVVTRQQDGCD